MTDLFPWVSYQLSSSSWSPGKFYPAVKEKIDICKIYPVADSHNIQNLIPNFAACDGKLDDEN
jgi:hypothetical protein